MLKKGTPLNKLLSVVVLIIIVVVIVAMCGGKKTTDTTKDDLSHALFESLIPMSLNEYNLENKEIHCTAKYPGDYSTGTIAELSLNHTMDVFFEEHKDIDYIEIIAYGIEDNQVHQYIYERNGLTATLKDSQKIQ